MSASADGLEYRGGCHCGTLVVRYRTSLAPAQWSVRTCQCAFCRRHGAVSTSDPSGSLSFDSDTPQRIQRYRFGTRTAEFLICGQCGVYVGATISSSEGRFGVLNLLTLESVPAGTPAPQPMNYEGEALATRAQRRQQRWTPLAASSL
ncbi:MAG TPA: hypothetical protein VME21_10970 [Steroidobacteraceae bacterium]|nr:hypothetical protein [Steroidobacteraceae bacterium]